MQNTTFNENQSETVIATPNGLLASGNIPAWSIDPSSPQTGLALTPASNGLSCVLAATAPGLYQVNVAAQNSAGGNFVTSFTATINQVAATEFTFTFGTPQ